MELLQSMGNGELPYPHFSTQFVWFVQNLINNIVLTSDLCYFVLNVNHLMNV